MGYHGVVAHVVVRQGKVLVLTVTGSIVKQQVSSKELLLARILSTRESKRLGMPRGYHDQRWKGMLNDQLICDR